MTFELFPPITDANYAEHLRVYPNPKYADIIRCNSNKVRDALLRNAKLNDILDTIEIAATRYGKNPRGEEAIKNEAILQRAKAEVLRRHDTTLND